MIYTHAHPRDYDEQASQLTLPERLGAEGVRLMIADGISLLALVGLSVPFDGTRGAWLAALTIFVCGVLFGRYRQSFAPTAHDEWYATFSVTLIAAVVSVALVPLFDVPWWICAAVLVAWSIVGGAAADALTAHRRGDEPAIATTSFLSSANRRRLRNPVVHSTIATMDFVFAACASVVLSPFLLIAAIAIAFERSGPILSLQHRIGVDGREFYAFKFRTMKAAGVNSRRDADDDGMTKVGRFLQRSSLADMPQLWNVLRGEMSLVGPLPEKSEHADRFVRTVPFYEDRHAIRPGITGWEQIQHGGNASSSESEEVLRYNLFYVANYSISLYLFCLMKAVFGVQRHRAD